MASMPHQACYKLRPKFGPVLWINLGPTKMMVVQSSKAAEELFRNHDLSFCDRLAIDALTSHNYKNGSLIFGSYGPYWRMLRRLCASELFVNRRINETTYLRTKCVDDMIRWIEEASNQNRKEGGLGEVEVVDYLFLMAFNLVGNLTMSCDMADPGSKQGKEFLEAMNNIMEWVGKMNVADVWPILKWLDPQGIKRGMNRDLGKAMEIVAGSMKERVEEKKRQPRSDRGKKDFLSSVLDYEGDAKEGISNITDNNAVVLILEMFLAGSDTTSNTLEWALTELLRKPELMKKVQAEIDEVIGPHRKVEESDLDKLKYLQAVLKETLRLHPPAPVLAPRRAMQDTVYMGYHIPEGTQVLINVWAIGKDPDAWDDPLSFKPERFLGSTIEYKGQNYEFLPFGAGRRICVGLSLAHQTLHLALASLVQHFDWKLDITAPKTMNMEERMGIALRKLVPLKAIPTKRFV